MLYFLAMAQFTNIKAPPYFEFVIGEHETPTFEITFTSPLHWRESPHVPDDQRSNISILDCPIGYGLSAHGISFEIFPEFGPHRKIFFDVEKWTADTFDHLLQLLNMASETKITRFHVAHVERWH